jgi:hypothetical protein
MAVVSGLMTVRAQQRPEQAAFISGADGRVLSWLATPIGCGSWPPAVSYRLACGSVSSWTTHWHSPPRTSEAWPPG